MIKPFVKLQELRRRIYRKAKAEKTWRFLGSVCPCHKGRDPKNGVSRGQDQRWSPWSGWNEL